MSQMLRSVMTAPDENRTAIPASPQPRIVFASTTMSCIRSFCAVAQIRMPSSLGPEIWFARITMPLASGASSTTIPRVLKAVQAAVCLDQ